MLRVLTMHRGPSMQEKQPPATWLYYGALRAGTSGDVRKLYIDRITTERLRWGRGK